MARFKQLKILVQLAIGVAIIFWLLQMVDLSKVYEKISEVNPLNIVTAATLFIVASTFVAFALYAPLKRSHPNASLRKVVMASFAGQLLSDVTPVRSGYFLTPFVLNKLADIPIERTMISVLTTGGVNSLVKVILCLIGIVYFVRFLPLDPMIVNALLIGASLLLVAGSFLLLLMWEKRLVKLVKAFEKLPLIGKRVHKFTEMFINVQNEGQKIKGSLLSVAVLILLSVIANATALYFISVALWHNPPSLIDFFFMASLASALMYIPISIAGLGVQETGYVVFLQLLGMKPEVAVAFALIARALFTGTDIIGVGALIKTGFKYRG